MLASSVDENALLNYKVRELAKLATELQRELQVEITPAKRNLLRCTSVRRDGVIVTKLLATPECWSQIKRQIELAGNHGSTIIIEGIPAVLTTQLQAVPNA